MYKILKDFLLILNFFMFRNYYSDTACLCLLYVFGGSYWFVNSFLFFKASTSSQWYCQYFPQFLIWLLSLFKMFLIEIFIFFPLWFLPLSYAQDVCFHTKIIYMIINVLVQFFIHITFTDLYWVSYMVVISQLCEKKSLPLWSFSLVENRP